MRISLRPLGSFLISKRRYQWIQVKRGVCCITRKFQQTTAYREEMPVMMTPQCMWTSVAVFVGEIWKYLVPLVKCSFISERALVVYKSGVPPRRVRTPPIILIGCESTGKISVGGNLFPMEGFKVVFWQRKFKWAPRTHLGPRLDVFLGFA